MLASKVEAHEKGFKNTKKDTNGTIYTISPKTKESGLKVKKLKPKGISDYFYSGEHPKQNIVLHFTAGYLRGDLGAMVRQGKHVCVPYLVARSGDIYEIFDPKTEWAYHLGKGAIGGNTVMSKASVAIEISNIGPLELKDGNLHTVYGDKYCSLNQTQYFTKLDKTWRGYDYFASYTDAQVNAVIDLLKDLTGQFNLPTELLPEDKRYKTFSSSGESRGFKGITSHINYRKTGKWDIGPAFPWDKVSAALNGDTEMVIPEVEVKAEPVKKVVKKAVKQPVKKVVKQPAKKAPAPNNGLISVIMGIIKSLFGR